MVALVLTLIYKIPMNGKPMSVHDATKRSHTPERRELTERCDHLWKRATDLLTFWPPGPLDRLKDTMPIRRGIVLESKVASHSLAARRCSSSDCWPGVGCLAVDVDNRMRNGDDRLMGRNPRDIIVNGAAIIIAVVLSWNK